MAYNDVSNRGNQNKSKKYSIIGLCSALLVAMVVAVAVGANRGGNDDDPKSVSNEGLSTSMKSIKAICQPTDYKETCEKHLSSAASNTSDPKELIKVGFHVAMQELGTAMANSTTLKKLANDPRAKQALENCKELLEYAVDDLQVSFEKIGAFEVSKLDDYLADLKVWLSGAITYEQTCLDGFENTTGDAGDKMKAILKTSQELTKNGLAMVAEVSTILTGLQIPGMKRLLSVETGQARDPVEVDEVPSWINEEQRKLLAATTPTNINADVVVAKDGSGKYKTINEALVDIPKMNSKAFVIYIKEGVYQETVALDKFKTFVTMIGDGPTKTKITGSKNFIDGTPTFDTATVSVIGNNFMAKNIGFENSAGAAKHQAVALRVQSDSSIFYNCQMDGYQDTLYTHTHRQFYRDCTISGTIDFIFGDASAVFQNCKMIIRKPMENQQCIVTAQGRSDVRETTGIVLQGCTITGDPAYLPVKDTNKAFLGRPWRQYSRTIIMQSHIEAVIQPEGWLPWMGNFALDTCFYAEVANMGPGAGLANRVKWLGIKTLNLNQAQQFTPGTFLSGNSWIQPTGVPYVPGLL